MFKPSRISNCVKLFQNPINPQNRGNGPLEVHFYAGQSSDNYTHFSDIHRRVSNAVRCAISRHLTLYNTLADLQIFEICRQSEHLDSLLEVRFTAQFCFLSGDDAEIISQLRLHRDETHVFENNEKVREHLNYLAKSAQSLILSWLQEAYCDQQGCVASFLMMDVQTYHSHQVTGHLHR